MFSGDHQHAAFSFLDGRTVHSKLYSGLLALLVTLDVIVFFLSTLDYLLVSSEDEYADGLRPKRFRCPALSCFCFIVVDGDT